MNGGELARGPDRAFARRELWMVAAGALALLFVPLLVPSFRTLLTRPLWLDELHTWLLARDLPSLALIARLKGGADFNPPLLFVVDSLLLHLLPGVPAQATVRLTSVLAVAGTMLMLYRIFRRRMDVIPSAAGAIAPLAHPTLHSQLFEARFYAPWMLLTVAVAWALQGVIDHPRSRGRLAVLALLSAATCLMHYFGVISLACLALGVIVQQRAPARLVRPMVGIALGVVALAAWLPVYAVQRRVLSVSTWVPATTFERAHDYLGMFIGYPAYAGVLALLGLLALRRDPPRTPAVTLTVAHAALLGLLALPVVLVLFSVVVQPSLVPRYALPAVAGGACLVALATARLPRPLPVFVVLMLLATHAVQLRRRAREARNFAQTVASAVSAVNGVAGDPRPVVTIDRGMLYATALSSVNRNPRLAFLVVPPDSFRKHADKWEDAPEFGIVERDAAVAHNRTIGFPSLMPLERLPGVPSFFMLMPLGTGNTPLYTLVGNRAVCRVQARLVLYGPLRPGPAPMRNPPIPRCRGTEAP